MWDPENGTLGIVAEHETFAFDIFYYVTDGDPLADPPIEGDTTYYPVKITQQGITQDTVVITLGVPGGLNDPGTPSTISGYFRNSFNDTLQYRNFNNKIITLDSFAAVDRNDVFQATSFAADNSRNVFSQFLAEAYDGSPSNVIASTTYEINIQDFNWTPGMLELIDLVAYTENRRITKGR
jgi:hypothetical protein